MASPLPPRPDSRPPSKRFDSARLVAPLALALVTVVLLILIGSAISGGDDEPASQAGTEQQGGGGGGGNGGGGGGGDGGEGGGGGGGESDTPKRYTIESGDNLGSIAAEFGLDVDEILELNPDLDPQALTTGEKIKLR